MSLVVEGFYFSDHSGTLPGVQGAPAASISFSSFVRSTSTSVLSLLNCSVNSAAAILYESMCDCVGFASENRSPSITELTRSLIDDAIGSLRFAISTSPRNATKISRSRCSMPSATAPICFSTAGASRNAARIAFTRDSTSSAVCSAPDTAR